MSTVLIQPVRCVGCRSTLFFQGVMVGVIEIKCRKKHCQIINTVEFDQGRARVKRKEGQEELAHKTYAVLK